MERYFEWDETKAQTNYRKHGISFSAAARVFDDPLHYTRQDRIENGEYRWQTIGLVEGCLVLLVAHTLHTEIGDEGDIPCEVIRIISARRATKQERKSYERSQI